MNNKTEQSYIDNGFADILENNLMPLDIMEKRFLSEVDVSKGPIERTVTRMFRLKAIDLSTTKRERKENIYYEEDWEGKNWLGIPIRNPVREHIEGRYMEQLKGPVFDRQTATHIEYKYDGQRERYYIPSTKKKVDEIIAISAHSSKENIVFIVKFSPEDSANGGGMSHEVGSHTTSLLADRGMSYTNTKQDR